MILESYQCESCYFEDREPSSRVEPETISRRQPKKVFRNVFLIFICIELYDSRQELKEAADEFVSLSDMLGKRPVVLCPNVHLSVDKAPERQASFLISEFEKMLTAGGYDVHLLSFGYHKRYGMECNGNVGSVVGRRFYGSQEKQFLRLLTRFGICPPDSGLEDMPEWARTLSKRKLRVLGSRRETYNVANQMLDGQLDATGRGELWTCMLFEGERKPYNDYISKLYEIVDDYTVVRMHRAFNLSVPGFSNAARFLFRKFPEAIESGRLRIYNSKVSDLEFLLTKTEVLLAFPHIPRRASSHAGEISFGIYCRDKDFANNLIEWYRSFLVDARFGWIRTETELDATISELEEESYQDSSG